jgi:NADPH:quinone reductase-like Zn-dependent oxidoreductase
VVATLSDDVIDWQTVNWVLVRFIQAWLRGPVTQAGQASMTGLTRPGVLAEYTMLPATALVRILDYLPILKAATLLVGGLTTWTALI